jgi:hypothetical protein
MPDLIPIADEDFLDTLAWSQQSGRGGNARSSSVTCFRTGEQVSGMNKICYYNCLGSAAAITISAVSLCPLSIQQ